MSIERKTVITPAKGLVGVFAEGCFTSSVTLWEIIERGLKMIPFEKERLVPINQHLFNVKSVLWLKHNFHLLEQSPNQTGFERII